MKTKENTAAKIENLLDDIEKTIEPEATYFAIIHHNFNGIEGSFDSHYRTKGASSEDVIKMLTIELVESLETGNGDLFKLVYSAVNSAIQILQHNGIDIDQIENIINEDEPKVH